MGKFLTFGLVVVVCIILLNNTTAVVSDSTLLNEDRVPSRFLISDVNLTRSLFPDRCVYPSQYEIENTSSFQIRGNYEGLVSVSEESAVNASLTFIETSFPDELTSGLRLVAPEEGYWPGAPTLIIDWWPRWAMTIVSDYLEAAVYVNAISGRVVDFSLYVYDKSVSSYTPIQNVEEAESKVLDFFERHNYTLLPDAVYDGTNLFSQPRNPYYSVSFHQEINQTVISYSEIYFKIDATYGVIEHFTYKWIEIEMLPMNRIIPISDVPMIVQDEFIDSSEVNILDIKLRLEMIDFSPDSPEFVMRLLYAVEIVSGSAYVYNIDALTGEILSREILFSEPFLVVYSPYFQVMLIIAISLSVSFLSYRLLEKRKLGQ
jgi:hypothetical protein